MKSCVCRWFGPAIQFLNRYSFPRKFAIAGSLVVLPLCFVTWQYVTTVNERVELSQNELAGNQAIRSLVPLWRVLREVRLGTVMATVEDSAREKAVSTIREHLRQLLAEIESADRGRLLRQSTRWMILEKKLQVMLSTNASDRASLWAPEILNEMIADLHTVLGQVADVSQLSVDPHLDSQNLAQSVTRLIPNLVELEDQLRQRLASVNAGPPLDLKLAEFTGGLGVLFDRVQQQLNLCMARNPETATRLRSSLSLA